MGFDQIGPALCLGMSAVGSSIGCGIAGMASHGVMARVEEGHGKFIGVSAAPSSQTIYGFILMLLLNKAILAGSITALAGMGIGFAAGLGLMLSAIYQGRVAATAIQSSARQPSIFGKCLVAVGVVESFSLFVFVFSLMLL